MKSVVCIASFSVSVALLSNSFTFDNQFLLGLMKQMVICIFQVDCYAFVVALLVINKSKLFLIFSYTFHILIFEIIFLKFIEKFLLSFFCKIKLFSFSFEEFLLASLSLIFFCNNMLVFFQCFWYIQSPHPPPQFLFDILFLGY